MGISEIAKQEKINAGQIWLYKEGIFWRAYEVSAYLFSCNIKKYTVKQKFIKKIDREIVFLGFPDKVFETNIQNIDKEKISLSDKLCVIDGFDFVPGKFTDWKETIPVELDKKKNMEHNKEIKEKHIIDKLKSFNVVNETPLACQQFIIDIQSELNGTLR